MHEPAVHAGSRNRRSETRRRQASHRGYSLAKEEESTTTSVPASAPESYFRAVEWRRRDRRYARALGCGSCPWCRNASRKPRAARFHEIDRARDEVIEDANPSSDTRDPDSAVRSEKGGLPMARSKFAGSWVRAKSPVRMRSRGCSSRARAVTGSSSIPGDLTQSLWHQRRKQSRAAPGSSTLPRVNRAAAIQPRLSEQ